jgi:hypothetical protein
MVVGLLHEVSAVRASTRASRDQVESFMRASVAGEGPRDAAPKILRERTVAQTSATDGDIAPWAACQRP